MDDRLMDMYRRHHRIILAQLRGRVDAQDMEDALHAVVDAMLGKQLFLESLSDMRQAMYIRSVARNIAMDYLRARVRRRERLADGPDEDMERIADARAGVEQQVFRADTIGAMQAAIRKLPEEKRQLLEMKYLQDMPDGQIAQRLGIQKDNVRQRLSRVRRELRAMMEEMGYEKEDH